MTDHMMRNVFVIIHMNILLNNYLLVIFIEHIYKYI